MESLLFHFFFVVVAVLPLGSRMSPVARAYARDIHNILSCFKGLVMVEWHTTTYEMRTHS